MLYSYTYIYIYIVRSSQDERRTAYSPAREQLVVWGVKITHHPIQFCALFIIIFFCFPHTRLYIHIDYYRRKKLYFSCLQILCIHLYGMGFFSKLNFFYTCNIMCSACDQYNMMGEFLNFFRVQN